MEKVKIPEDIVDALDKKARLIVDSRPDCPAWVYESLMNMGGYAAGLSMRNLSNLPEDVKYEKPVRDLKAIFRRMTSEERRVFLRSIKPKKEKKDGKKESNPRQSI